MNDIQLFQYEGRQVRTAQKDGETWFVARDVCEILDLTNTTEALRSTDQDDRGTLRISEGGPEVNIINESGLYSLILRSTKAEAKRFKKWITSEVIPSIRKTGSYSLPQTDEMVLANAVLLANRMIEAQKAEIIRMAPKEQIFDRCMSSDDALDMDAVGKMFGIGRNTLFAKLRSRGILRSNNVPYQEYAQYFKLVEKARMPDSMGIIRIDLSPKLRQTGLTWMARILGHGYQKQLPMGA